MAFNSVKNAVSKVRVDFQLLSDYIYIVGISRFAGFCHHRRPSPDRRSIGAKPPCGSEIKIIINEDIERGKKENKVS